MKNIIIVIITLVLSTFIYSCKKSYTCDCSYVLYKLNPAEIIKLDTIPATDSTDMQLTLDTIQGYDTTYTQHNVSFSLKGMQSEEEAKTGCYLYYPDISSYNCHIAD